MKKLFYVLLLIGVLTVFFALHYNTRGENREVVALTVWHTYVEQMGDSFGVLVREFNDTVGAKEGIVVSVTKEANASSLNEMLIASAKRDPGASPCPDMAVMYPKIAVELAGLNALADLGTLFSQNELDRYVPNFLEEGMLGGDTLYILPIAKSTEVLFVNKTLFDRFAREAGIDVSSLATFEGIVDAAEKYYAWTDAQTPDISDDGKTFYYPDNPFNYAMIGFEQLGDRFVKNGALDFDAPAFQKIWDSYFPHAVRGRVAVFDKFANYLAMTGDIVCATSTSAGAMFYPKTVIYADNTKEDVSFDVLPYPIFEGGERIVAQRGGGMCILKSNGEKERASALFLKWLTDPVQNLRFTASTGYMPAMKEAFDLILADGLGGIENDCVRKALKTTVAMRDSYRFHSSPVFDGFDELQRKYAGRLIGAAKDAKREYRESAESFDFTVKKHAFGKDF